MSGSGSEEIWVRADRERAVSEILDKVPAEISNWKGHFRNGSQTDWVREQLPSELKTVGWLDPRGAERILQASESGFQEPAVFSLGLRRLLCPYCGKDLRVEFHGDRFEIAGPECEHPEGLIADFELNVPSGRIAISDDLRPWFPGAFGDYNINTMYGVYQTILSTSACGYATGFVGNTSPSVYWDGERYRIANGSGWGKEETSITTDLWWYSIADFDELMLRHEHYAPFEEFRGVSFVDVKPGVYRFRQDLDVDRDAAVVSYAEFQWVREPDPVQDFLAVELSKKVTLLEYVLQCTWEYPNLYGLDEDEDPAEDRSLQEHLLLWERLTDKQRAGVYAKVADRLFCVLGAGNQWHENGFPQVRVDGEISEYVKSLGATSVPMLNGPYRWYPVTEDYKYSPVQIFSGLGEDLRGEISEELASNLRADFVQLALVMCRSALKYGVNQYHSSESDLETMKVFFDAYFAFRERYPNVELPLEDLEFETWVGGMDRSEFVSFAKNRQASRPQEPGR